MENIAKALNDLQKALENNPIVKTVKVTITLQKTPKSKADTKDSKTNKA